MIPSFTSARGSVISVAQRDPLEIQIVKAMAAYSDDVKASIQAGFKTISEDALQRVKAASPVYKVKKYRGGKYKRGWKSEVTEDGSVIRLRVYQSKSQAKLTHLLEDGHRTRNKKGWVKAQPHIRAVEDWAGAEAEKVIEKAVKK